MLLGILVRKRDRQRTVDGEREGGNRSLYSGQRY